MSDDQSTLSTSEGTTVTPTDGASVTSVAAPQNGAGQAPSQEGQAPGQALSTQDADSFFDYASIADKPELVAAYKQMQSQYTKKSQALAKDRQKIEVYNQFERDPVGTMQSLAAQYGMTLTRAQAAQAVQAQQQQEEFAPKTWDDVFSHMQSRIMSQIEEKLAPVFGTVQKVQAKNIESELDRIDPNWRTFETEMGETLRAHPTLVGNVAALYRLSVPEEVQQSKYVQQALKKLESKGQAAKVESPSTSKSAPVQRKASSFNEAVAIAKEMLSQGKGI